MARRLGEVGRKRAEGSRVSVSEGVNGIEFVVVVGQPLCDRAGIQAQEAVLGFQGCEGSREGAGDIRGGSLSDHKARGAGFRHHSDVFGEFAGPRVHIAEDAAMGFLQAVGVERACDGVYCETIDGQEDRVRLELVQFGLDTIIAPI